MNKTSKIISTFMGFSMFAFGTLKFLNPFKNWYTIQVHESQLPFEQFSFWSGQIGEIIVGVMFLFAVYKGKSYQHFRNLFLGANLMTIGMMVVAMYVHLHPAVPNDVLPLKIKPPVIPLFFTVLPLINMYLNKELLKIDEFKRGLSIY